MLTALRQYPFTVFNKKSSPKSLDARVPNTTRTLLIPWLHPPWQLSCLHIALQCKIPASGIQMRHQPQHGRGFAGLARGMPDKILLLGDQGFDL